MGDQRYGAKYGQGRGRTISAAIYAVIGVFALISGLTRDEPSVVLVAIGVVALGAAVFQLVKALRTPPA